MSAARWSLRASAARLTLAVLLTLVLAAPAAAIQLHWAGGGTNLTVSQATHAVLVVEADSAEIVLPGSWRLLWTADSSGIEFLPFDSTTACLVDTARVWSVEPPLTAADSSSNQVTAHFCSGGAGSASIGYWILGLSGESQGKLKVVALDSNDTTQVVESNQVTFNGGVDWDYLPAILSVQSDHHTTVLRLQLAGSELDAITSMSLSAPELGAPVPLNLVSQTSSLIVATADIQMPLPACDVRFRASEQQLTFEGVPADQVPNTPLPYRWVFRDTSIVYPKDFAFINTPQLVSGE